jgi:acetylornithine deacetylase/succinyl-diaminopimelate desuccinylase-like protein
MAAFGPAPSARADAITPAPLSSTSRLPQVHRALDYLKTIEPETIEEQVTITEIPAPTFQEQKRAAYFKQRFTELGLRNVRIDRAGNAIGERPGAGGGPTLVIAAHLDTVFDEDTNVTVKRDGAVLKAPGIGDDGRGLAVLLAIARALNEARIKTQGTILFVGNVAEEGLGDLKGVRHLFQEELKGRITHFISIDGAGLGITNKAVGSNRYRVTYRGPGGHSYGAFGMPSPVHALGRAVEKIARFEAPKEPKTTFNVGRIEGGASVNAIADSAWMEVDLRSESAAELARIDAAFKRAVQTALEEENARTLSVPTLSVPTLSVPTLSVEVKPVGQRPAGEQPAEAPIVQTALAADAVLGATSNLRASSTDSNLPISLGIPAITIGGGGQGNGAHSLDESFDTTDSHLGTQRALLIALGIVGVK